MAVAEEDFESGGEEIDARKQGDKGGEELDAGTLVVADQEPETDPRD